MNTLQVACMLFLFFKMRENGWFIKSFLLIGFVYGLSLAHHWPNQIVMAPAYLWFFLASQKRVPLCDDLSLPIPSRLRPFDLWENYHAAISCRHSAVLNIIRAIICGLLSLSVYMYLPIRATQNPLVNWWNPQTAGRLWGTVMREGYKGVGDMRGWTTIDRDLKRFWIHAHHQFGDIFTYLLFALAIWGFVLALEQANSGLPVIWGSPSLAAGFSAELSFLTTPWKATNGPSITFFRRYSSPARCSPRRESRDCANGSAGNGPTRLTPLYA